MLARFPLRFLRLMRINAFAPALLAAMFCAIHSDVAAAQSNSVSSAPAQNQAASRRPLKVSPATRVAIDRLADSVRQAGMPWEAMLYDKAAEGVLKGASESSIVAAVRTLTRELSTASNLLGSTASVSDIVSAASALRAGVPLSAAQRLVARTTKGGTADTRLASAFIIITDFASRGVPIDAAVNAVDGLLARGAERAELDAFRSGVVRDLLSGRDARTTLQTRAEVVMRRP